MLKNVYIKNLALIEEADIDYANGLNIMTGETGAGKSIIISALNTALGEKANKSMIRAGSDYGLVELVFLSDDSRIFDALKEKGITLDGNQITITRKISADSSTTRINGETVTLANLKSITNLLVDVHGQHDHQSLLDPSRHLDIVDAFAGDPVRQVKTELRNYYDQYRQLKIEYLHFNLDEESLAREIDLLKYEKKEIEEAALEADEDVRLESEYKKLSNAETILVSMNRAYQSFSDEEEGTLKKVSDALKYVDEALPYEPELKEYRNVLLDIDSLAKDLTHEMSHYIDRNQFDGERLKEVQDRLDVINKLKSKYGNAIEEIYRHDEKISAKLDEYENYYERKAEKESQMKECAVKLNKLAYQLSDLRKEAASRLEPLIQDNLKDLNFLNVEFVISFIKGEKISSNGFDKAEFLISVNPGEPLLPLAKTASGGELSRIMLAIKSAIAENDHIPTLIFDEIDTGISGKTAGKVGEKLVFLSQKHQIICITHLPQIAAMADTHFRIQKEVEEGSTISGIEKLTKDEQVEELAKLVGGVSVSDAARTNAKELIDYAAKLKQ